MNLIENVINIVVYSIVSIPRKIVFALKVKLGVA